MSQNNRNRYEANPDAETQYLRPVEVTPKPRQQQPVTPQPQYRETYYTRQNDDRQNRESAPQPYTRQPEEDTPSLIAGKFDPSRLALNLGIYALLSGIVTFAVVLATDAIVSRVADIPAMGNGHSVIVAVIVMVVALLAGLAYIPVDGTGNEGMYNFAIVALAIAAIVFYVLFAGLLDGDWSRIVALTGILCGSIAAYAASARVVNSYPQS